MPVKRRGVSSRKGMSSDTGRGRESKSLPKRFRGAKVQGGEGGKNNRKNSRQGPQLEPELRAKLDLLVTETFLTLAECLPTGQLNPNVLGYFYRGLGRALWRHKAALKETA